MPSECGGLGAYSIAPLLLLLCLLLYRRERLLFFSLLLLLGRHNHHLHELCGECATGASGNLRQVQARGQIAAPLSPLQLQPTKF